MTVKEFAVGWKHFCKCIDFNHSYLDAKAIRFMDEMPSAVAKGLTRNKTNAKRESPKSSN